MADDKDDSKRTLEKFRSAFAPVQSSLLTEQVEKLKSTFAPAQSSLPTEQVEKFITVMLGVTYERSKKRKAIAKLHKLSPYAENGGISPLEQAKKKLFPLVLDSDIEGIEYNIEFEVLDLQEEAKPIMTVYQLCVMLTPPIFSDIHRVELQQGIFTAIQEWGMPVCADRIEKKTEWELNFPETLGSDPKLFERIPTDDTRIHIEVFQKYAREGKIIESAVQYAESWREYIRLHEKRIRLENSNSKNNTSLNNVEQKEKLDRCIQSAKHFAENINQYLIRNEKKSLFSVFRRVMEKEQVSKSWLYEKIPDKEKKEIYNLLNNKE